MKNSICLALAMFFLSSSVKAQDCKFDIKEKDKFSGTSKVGYWYQLGTDMLTIYKMGDKITFEISSTYRGAMKQGIEKGAVGQMRLANGEMISFTASENVEPEITSINATSEGSATANSSIKAKFDITREEFAKLAASAPIAMKVMMGSKEVVKEFSEKKSEKMRAEAQCLLEFKG